MKIFLLYTPRSGSTSILKYFQKNKPEYHCFNEPWFDWMISNIYKENISYEDILKNENVFVKSALKTLPINVSTIVRDFDKVIILLRKDKKSQSESSILAHKEESFLNYKKRKYNLYLIEDEERKWMEDRYDFLNTELLRLAELYNLSVYYYEDLYYNSFEKLFEEIELDFNEEYFKEFLDISKKYRESDIIQKVNKSII